jgi:23S rRNA-/tRNA-specific pseudouridylate synthase
LTIILNIKKLLKSKKMTPQIIYEDNHILIVNKPSGILSQGDISGKDSMVEILKSYIKKLKPVELDAFIKKNLEKQRQN